MIELLLAYAFTFMHTPYVWAGNNVHQGVDCSGLVLEVLRGVGVDYPDMTAQQLYASLNREDSVSEEPSRGNILFFGKSTNRITHVAIAVNGKIMVEAGGAGRNATMETSKKDGAGVRLRKIRGDLVASVNIQQLLNNS